MIRTGYTQELAVLRKNTQGTILGDEDGEVLLPHGEQTDPDQETLTVFVYRGPDGVWLATQKVPKAEAGGFARMRVMRTGVEGAYMDWGSDHELFVPVAEQKKALVEGKWYITRVVHDERSDQVIGSTRLEDFLDNTSVTLQRGDQVTVMVFGRSALGLAVIVNDRHHGLIHASDLFRHVSVGDRITGYVKQVREDRKLDITLQPIGYRQYNDANAALLAKRLQGGTGFLPLNDKSEAEDIHAELGMSKKAFKKALGALYKERLVRIEENGIVWVG